jgi:hypothetical protein
MERAVVAWLMTHDKHDPDLYLADLMRRPKWMSRGACRDQPTDLFFPSKGQPTAPAKRICGTCAVRAECLAYSLETEAEGIWGGTATGERQKLRALKTAV